MFFAFFKTIQSKYVSTLHYRYSEIKEYYPPSEGEFYYLIKILARYRSTKTQAKEKQSLEY